jgi:hypothetical protein
MESAQTKSNELSVSGWPEWRWFDSVEILLGETLFEVQKHKPDAVGALYPFLDSIFESTGSLRTLVSQLKLRDSYVS